MQAREDKNVGTAQESEGRIEALERELKDLEDKFGTTKKQYEDLLANVREAGKGKKGKANPKLERNKDIVSRIEDFVSDHLWRNMKFLPTPNMVETAAEKVWDGIKVQMKLEESPHKLDIGEFQRIYEGTIIARLGYCRQYTQSRAQNAGKGAFNFVYFTLNLANCGLFTLNLVANHLIALVHGRIVEYDVGKIAHR